MTEDSKKLPESGLPEGEKKMSLPEVLALAGYLQQHNLMDESEELYETVLEAIPDQPDALHFLGVLKHRRGQTEAGIDLIERAIALVPDHPDMHSNLGNLIRSTQQTDAAEAAYRRAIELDPGHVDAQNNLAVILKDRGQLEDAETAFRAVLAAAPDKVEALLNLASTLRKQGKNDEAIEVYTRANELTPFKPETIHQLSRIYNKTGRHREAQELYRKWLEHDPDNAEAKHMLAASLGTETPSRASDEYVQSTFDSFANSFDFVLQRIDYRAPYHVRDSVVAALGEPEKSYDVLDAGCGTGLCGALMVPFARRLDGVDLSPAMVERAKDREIYDTLHVAELTGFLESVPNEYDVVVSADTLCYFGQLENAFAATAKALRPGGLFVVTLERDDEVDASPGYRLHSHGRYSHREDYVRQCLTDAGLISAAITEEVLRQEGNDPVNGFVVSASKPAGETT